MAVRSRERTELQMPNKWKERETSPGRAKVLTEIKPKTERRVPVVYYLSRNGSLEHPHFMEVPLSSSEGLYLKDVINRLNSLRGKGMASLYSWSSKRSYKNGYVWQDLSENDFIYPAHGQEYFLKGSELLEAPLNSCISDETLSSTSSLEKRTETQESEDDWDSPVTIVRRRNPSLNSIDLNEYKVYKTESNIELAGKAADAATQTDDIPRRRRNMREEKDEIKDVEEEKNSIGEEGQYGHQTTELSREEISPPPSSSSSETLENPSNNVHKVNVNGSSHIHDQKVHNHHPSGRLKASAVLMQLISCGVNCSSIDEKDEGFSLISYYKSRLPRGGSGEGSNQVVSNSKEFDYCLIENPSFSRIQLDEKEYTTNEHLIEIKEDKFSALERSSYSTGRPDDSRLPASLTRHFTHWMIEQERRDGFEGTVVLLNMLSSFVSYHTVK